VALMIPPKNLRLHYDAEHGWLLDVPWLLSDAMAQRAVDWALKMQIDRWRAHPPGDLRNDLEGGIKKLQDGQYRQHVVGPTGDGKGDLVIFSGTKGI
jgi:hypothetical protein